MTNKEYVKTYDVKTYEVKDFSYVINNHLLREVIYLLFALLKLKVNLETLSNLGRDPENMRNWSDFDGKYSFRLIHSVLVEEVTVSITRIQVYGLTIRIYQELFKPNVTFSLTKGHCTHDWSYT